MACCIAVFSPECGAKGVDLAKCQTVGLNSQLTAYGQTGALPEKVLAIIYLSGRGSGRILQINCGYLEHFASPLTVTGGYDWGVNINKAPVLEKLVNGMGQQRTDAEDR